VFCFSTCSTSLSPCEQSVSITASPLGKAGVPHLLGPAKTMLNRSVRFHRRSEEIDAGRHVSLCPGF
jgi:hypothetical protein